jgi:ribosomal protein S18 acetylase RimI-like enzyme
MKSARPATADDTRGIAEVQVATWRGAYRHVFPAEVLDALDVEERERMWQRVLANEDMAVFVTEEGGPVNGFVSVGASRDVPGEGELYAIYVHPDAWGSGAGPALMAEGRRWLAERYPAAILWVLEDNPRARRFYEREGWTADLTRVDVVSGVEVPEVRYRVSFLDQR